jgi:hypothetical protein
LLRDRGYLMSDRTQIDEKSYLFRNIPENVHRIWKTVASLQGKTMEEFAIDAIKKQAGEILKVFASSTDSAGKEKV